MNKAFDQGFEDGFRKMYPIMKDKKARVQEIGVDFVEYCRGYYSGVKALEANQ